MATSPRSLEEIPWPQRPSGFILDCRKEDGFCTHNFPCPVCKKARATHDHEKNTFSPCTKCQSEGWKLSKRKKASAGILDTMIVTISKWIEKKTT